GQELALGRDLLIGSTRDGQQTARMDMTGRLQAAPAALEIVAPVRTGIARRVAFRIPNVMLPYSRPFQPRLKPLHIHPPAPSGSGRSLEPEVPGVYYDPDGGTLCIPGLEKPPDTAAGERCELSVGLSRRKEDGNWSSTRWTQVEIEADALRLRSLAAG